MISSSLKIPSHFKFHGIQLYSNYKFATVNLRERSSPCVFKKGHSLIILTAPPSGIFDKMAFLTGGFVHWHNFSQRPNF